MAKLGGKIDPQKGVEDYKEGFEIIEPGWKKIIINGSKVADNKGGTGKLLTFDYQLQDGTKRTMVDRLNIVHSSAKAQSIARATLSKIALSLGQDKPFDDTSVLHGRPFEVNIGIEEFPTNTGEIDPATNKVKMLKSNEAKGYRACGSGSNGTEPVEAAESAPQEASGW